MIGGSYHDGRLSAGNDPDVERRIGVIAGLIALAFVIFVLRLFQLQIVQGADLRSRSERNFVRTLRLEAPRGEVVDREGRVMATTRPDFRVQAIPNELAGDHTFAILGNLLDAGPDALREQVGKPKGRARFQPVVLGSDLSRERFSQVEAHRYALRGVVTDIRPRRHYVQKDRAAHLLGTIGEVGSSQLATAKFADYQAGEIVGQYGLEMLLESHLRGRAGGRNIVVDVSGREIELLEQVAPVPGGRVVLSIDLDLQRAAEEAFAQNEPRWREPEEEGGERVLVEQPPKMGALVAMDPRNGEILAMVSRPAYDPNSFAGGIDSETWDALVSDPWKPLRNRAVSGQYSPGSTYKAIVAVAGLAEGEITPETTVFCPGHYRLGRRVYRCWKRGGHGEVDLDHALRGSCDVYFYQLGVKLGIDRIADYARRFGLGRLTGIPLVGEKAGLIPTTEWKERAKGEAWIEGETVSAAIGQGYNLVTPLQLATSYAAMANGGVLRKPKLVLRLETWDGGVLNVPPAGATEEVGVSPEVLSRVVEGLTEVVEGERGTGARARVKGVRVAGKTGTTQVVSLDVVKDMEEEEIPVRFRDHALFAAFAPVEAPEIVVAVLVEHAGQGGGTVAAPIAQRVLARYFEKRAARQNEASGEGAGEEGEGRTPRAPAVPGEIVHEAPGASRRAATAPANEPQPASSRLARSSGDAP